MGFYIRKSVRVGPFRFNLSKSGVGVSAGVPGLRVGSGPRGNYIHMGRGGLYYRKTFSSNGKVGYPDKPQSKFSEARRVEQLENTHEPLYEIESGDINRMVDSSSKDLVDELNLKRKRIRLWPWLLVVTVVAYGVIIQRGLGASVGYDILAAGLVLVFVAFYRDIVGKTTVMIYDIDQDFTEVLEQLQAAFNAMRRCRASWHLEAEGSVNDRKYHAGASKLVRRKSITLTLSNPPFVKTNIPTPSIPVGKQTLYFFPDKVLVFEPNGVGAVSYQNLRIDIALTRFIEDERIPKDAEVVDKTWKYVNKRGGPDKRFKTNPQLPVVRYEEIHFSSDTGLNERIQLSCTGQSADFVRAIKNIGMVGSAHG